MQLPCFASRRPKGKRAELQFAWSQLEGYPFRNNHFVAEEWDFHLTYRRFWPDFRILAIVVISMSPLWLWSVGVGAAVGVYATFAEPHGWPRISSHPNFVTPFTLTGFALSLLLLFKTNSSYARWWEARMATGALLVHCRNLVRLYAALIGRSQPQLLPALHRWTAAITPALAAYLRQKQHYLHFLEGLLHPQELSWLRAQALPPIAALQVLSELLEHASLGPWERAQLQDLLNRCDMVVRREPSVVPGRTRQLVRWTVIYTMATWLHRTLQVGICERILRQPIPPGYSRHTQRFLMVYLTFLPVAFWPLFGWATLPIMAVLSFLLLAIENIGVHLEEPFRVLPLNQIIQGTLKAVSTMAGVQPAAAAMATFAAGVETVPVEEERTVLRKSHADFSPRCSQMLAAHAANGQSLAPGWLTAVPQPCPLPTVPSAPDLQPPLPQQERQQASKESVAAPADSSAQHAAGATEGQGLGRQAALPTSCLRPPPILVQSPSR